MKTNRDFLIEALTIYADNIMRNSFFFFWNSLRVNVFITDISELKVRIEFVFIQSKDKYLRSCRRLAMNRIIEKLNEQLGIKKKYKIDVEFKEVRTSKDSWSGNIEYGDCYIRYLIPRDLYNKLEVLAKINKESITELNKTNEILIRNTVV